MAHQLSKRVNIPINATTPPQLIQAINTDPWRSSGKYGLGWCYFCIILLVCTTMFRVYNYWSDKIRTALFKEEVINSAIDCSPYQHRGHHGANVDTPARHFFPPTGPLLPKESQVRGHMSSFTLVHKVIAAFRFVFYRPASSFSLYRWRISFPPLGVVTVVIIGMTFSLSYCFIPSPLFYQSMAYGSPPLAIRAGMLSIALMPWVIALASKVNIISFMTGIEPQRLIVLHRWSAHLCALLAIIHAVPYWYQSVNDPKGYAIFRQWFHQRYYIFTTGIAAMAPLLFLILHSTPILRRRVYELFVNSHITVSWLFVAVMFWHCRNYLTSWAYLFATVILLAISLIGRIFFLNWSNPFRMSWLIGEEAAVTILPEHAVKVTVPTQQRWRPGQYAYLRMPGISILGNHPFTIASLCSEDFPSQYGEGYRDLTFVFRPFAGFTRRLIDTAITKGPYKTYRACIEGPYGGMSRQMSSFDQVIFFAGGSGITAIASQLLDLIKRMREGKATTSVVHVFWSMKRPEIMQWFAEELRICRDHAPPGSIYVNFYLTSNRGSRTISERSFQHENQSMTSVSSRERNSINKQSSGQKHYGFGFKEGNKNDLTALPELTQPPPPKFSATPTPYFPPPPRSATVESTRKSRRDKPASSPVTIHTTGPPHLELKSLQRPNPTIHPPSYAELPIPRYPSMQSFDFDFASLKPPTPPTVQPPSPGFRFFDDVSPPNQTILAAYRPHFTSRPPRPIWPQSRWQTHLSRPDIPTILTGLSRSFGARTCVFVCGPPSMQRDAARTVARLQRLVWGGGTGGKRGRGRVEEVYLFTERYES